MSKKTHNPLTVAPTAEELLAQDRHTDWEIAQAQGRNRNGRNYLGHRVHGVSKTKQGQSKRACRGKIRE